MDNQRKLYHTFRGLTKKENQYYLQTWHGSLGIKQIGLASPLTKKENDWVPLGIKDSKMINIVLSNSKFDDDVLYENFFHNVKTEKLGHPRNDIFFKDNAPEIKKIKSYYNIPHDKKIILYVPSFRDYKGFEWNILDYPKILNAFRAKYQSDFIFLSRMHPRNIYQNKVLIPKSKDIINATHYPDIMELLASADVLISDYSSCMFDFILTKKPIFVLAADKDKFTEERGLYYPLESTPIPIAEDNETLEYNILNFDVEKYKKGVELFLNEKGCIEDGKASIRVVDKIEKIMEGKIDE